MNNDSKLIFESYVDGITKTKNALGNHIMSIVKHGIPSKEEFIKIRQELQDKVKEIQERGTPPTEEEKERGQEIIAKIKNYRSQHPNDPPGLYPQNEPEYSAEDHVKDSEKYAVSPAKEEQEETEEERKERVRRKWELNKQRWNKWKAENPEAAAKHAAAKKALPPTYKPKDKRLGKSEEQEEDMSKSPFHYDPMHGLASAANKIKDELRSAANDEARPEHIEKMAEIILGPQSSYASVDHYERALSGVIELLNHYIMVEMN